MSIQLTRGCGDWAVCENTDGTYRVCSVNTRQVLAPSLTIDEAIQIVDEHQLALRLYATLRTYRGDVELTTPDGTVYRRPAL
jgi:hypothetical protein